MRASGAPRPCVASCVTRPRSTRCARWVTPCRGVAVNTDTPDASLRAPPTRPPVVIYEDDDLIAIDKPCGLSFHSDDLTRVHSGLATEPAPGLLAVVRSLQEAGELQGTYYKGELHSVHRLDKVTSGICVFAKSKKAAQALRESFRTRKAHKYYVALTSKKPSKKMGTVRGGMTQARRGAWKLVREQTKKKDEEGDEEDDGAARKKKKTTTAPAITKFVARGVAIDGEPFRFFVMKPITGKTHQLRVACKSLGAPLLGDTTYGGSAAKASDRTYLHAAAMRFAVPVFIAAEGKEREDGNDGTDGSSRVVEIFCKPSFGKLWVRSPWFHETWNACGFGDAEKGDVDVWFTDQPLLRSSVEEFGET